MKASILFSLILFSLLTCKANYQEQDLIEVAIEDRGLVEKEIRSLPSMKKRYPILDEFEKQLYPGRNFHKDSPDQRLQRIEIAVFGSKHEGSIKSRIIALELELEAWQIAQGKVSKYAKPKTNIKAVNQPVAQMPVQNFMPVPVIVNQSQKRQIDYDYMNYRMVTPLIQSTVRRGIGRMFQ